MAEFKEVLTRRILAVFVFTIFILGITYFFHQEILWGISRVEKAPGVSKAYFDVPREELPQGISRTKYVTSDLAYKELIGYLRRTYKEGDRYFLELWIVERGGTNKIKVDFGPQGLLIQERFRTLKSNNSERKDSVLFRELLKMRGNGEIVRKYGWNVGKVVRIAVYTDLDEQLFQNEKCVKECRIVWEEFNRYKESNRNFKSMITSNSESVMTEKDVQLGAVYEVSISKN